MSTAVTYCRYNHDARYSDVITMQLQQLLLYAESVAVVYQRQHHAGCQ